MMAVVQDLAEPSGTIEHPPKSSSLPVEIIYRIASFSGPLELILLGTISKQFRAIANDPTVWRTVYQNARLLRPPGPFSWQSTQFLKDTLVRSARLEQTWTSQPMKVTSSRQLVHELRLRSPNDYRWFSERWLLVQVEEKIVSHDIEIGAQQTLWDNGRISHWAVCSIMCAQGHLMYLVILTRNGEDHDSVKLLEFRADRSSGDLLGPVVFDVPRRYPEGPRSYVHCSSSKAPFVLITVGSLVRVDTAVIFDMRTRNFYVFPQSRTEQEELLSYNQYWFPKSEDIWFTMTHIFVVSSFCLDDDAYAQLIQAYIVPDSPIIDDSGLSELCFTHEAIHHGPPSPLILIRNSAVNSDDGSTTVKFIHTQPTSGSPRLQVVSVELSLPQAQPNALLPISLHKHEIFSFEDSNRAPRPQYVRASDDGFVRGFYATTNGEDHLVLLRFTIDASGERCQAVISGYPSLATDIEFLRAGSEIRWFDGVRGRVYYSKNQDNGDDTRASALDLVTFAADFE